MDCGFGELMDASSSADVLRDTRNFECNICFELAQEPIVTLCDHLYCWPCLYQWLRLHSHCHECPVFKAIVQGKSNCDPRSRSLLVPNRPMGTAPCVVMNEQEGAMSMPAPRFGHLTLLALFGALLAIFNLKVHGFHNAIVYGAPHLFSSSLHGAYVHGFQNYHNTPVEWKLIL